MTAVMVRCQRLAHARDLPLPALATAGAAGADLRAALGEKPLVIDPGARAAVPTGFRFAVPEGYEMQVRPRSGLALRHGVTVLNTPGTVDSDFRGEVMAILVNLGTEPFTVRHGDRIAQVLLAPVLRASFAEVAELEDTGRGSGGFGSTGR
ncbi:dUTP diphosphatase [Aureimonas leprariae]|uniref:Deoxyuridine 5'-triphosphate nucleotidohydrolase n=1 Tax=Plantimonas leprariae TaxID=2615207 RepID=A0A7V7TYB7_9HYPH|nr:dUTP diphosphatase [Aureimonas leprariae]